MTVEVKDLTVAVKGKEILSNVSFSLVPGRITLFIGRSGSGKTTILRSLVGLTPISSGSISVVGDPPGFVFQQPELFPHMTVLDNCAHPQMIVKKLREREAKDKALDLLGMLELREYASSYPHQLSGGQRQRVAIARALALDMRTILFDEPTSALDPFSASKFLQIVLSLKEQGMTIAISTHDILFINQCLDRVYLVDKGQIIDAYDSLHDDPQANSFVKQYLSLQEGLTGSDE
ncbi:amino acid ABC transporter ATP-binding protein [Chlamydia trachomatis]|uniref:amino acid ABC transporter ATP-binding protein n=1 Tax=Chlamydia trachomatis TaxID=813 RepID=UPI0001B47055|nr:amino acid ABC transporter ATP-binding protein [Chlamydia trachomatis]ADH17820.1 ABC transporter, ATP-binding component [Chlamydia trachomatis G/9768]ADH19667.1 ABC transporter, ATP-binding component [Chlamydia trachomatis G/11074]ADH96763.1 ABC transporter, ATP-binding component [Chlamydia trachomatis G/9301]AGS01926.1 ABC transporter, ATP-binding component [Chlamydia trachomatis J/6276tet1]AGT70605.1 amino acid ABC transporter ATP-binding protein [Chlamydia trachomatis]